MKQLANQLLTSLLIVASVVVYIVGVIDRWDVDQFEELILGEVSGDLQLVKRVVDGDTIVLESGERVRYIGIDSPEFEYQGSRVVGAECGATASAQMNRELVGGKAVRLESDRSDTDRYGRLLRYVYVDDIFVNQVLVEQGYAKSTAYPPDTYYQPELDLAEEQAKLEERGVWSPECLE